MAYAYTSSPKLPDHYPLLLITEAPVLHLLRTRMIRQHTSPPLMLLRLLVINQQLSTLPIAPRLIARDLDNREVRVAFAEDAVHFFERAVGCFGVEEVDGRDHEGVAGGWSVRGWLEGNVGEGMRGKPT